jgi:hypothetical protein
MSAGRRRPSGLRGAGSPSQAVRAGRPGGPSFAKERSHSSPAARRVSSAGRRPSCRGSPAVLVPLALPCCAAARTSATTPSGRSSSSGAQARRGTRAGSARSGGPTTSSTSRRCAAAPMPPPPAPTRRRAGSHRPPPHTRHRPVRRRRTGANSGKRRPRRRRSWACPRRRSSWRSPTRSLHCSAGGPSSVLQEGPPLPLARRQTPGALGAWNPSPPQPPPPPLGGALDGAHHRGGPLGRRGPPPPAQGQGQGRDACWAEARAQAARHATAGPRTL